MTKIVSLSIIVWLATILGVPAQTNDHPTTGTTDSTPMGKALALFGKVKSIELICTEARIYKKAVINKALDILDTKSGDMKDQPLTPASLLALAADICDVESDVGLRITVSDPQDIRTVQKILGKARVIRQPADSDPENGMRYNYGRWEFRAVNDSVKQVLLYCSTPRNN